MGFFEGQKILTFTLTLLTLTLVPLRVCKPLNITTACMESIHLLLNIAVAKDWDIQQVDIKTAFLYGLLPADEAQYLEQPEAFAESGKEDWVLCLQCGLYGMRQSGCIWNKTMHKAMLSWWFKCLHADPCIYYRVTLLGTVLSAVHIDNFLIISSMPGTSCSFKEELESLWTRSDLGALQSPVTELTVLFLSLKLPLLTILFYSLASQTLIPYQPQWIHLWWKALHALLPLTPPFQYWLSQVGMHSMLFFCWLIHVLGHWHSSWQVFHCCSLMSISWLLLPCPLDCCHMCCSLSKGYAIAYFDFEW